MKNVVKIASFTLLVFLVLSCQKTFGQVDHQKVLNTICLIRYNPELATRLANLPAEVSEKIFEYVFADRETYTLDECLEVAFGLMILEKFETTKIPGVLFNLMNRLPDPRAAKGKTLLMYAALRGKVKTIEKLLDFGADIHACEKEHDATALMVAALHGHAPAVRKLLERGAKIDAQNKHGRTPLMLTAENGHEAIVGVLIDFGADKEVLDRLSQWTALIIAVIHSRMAIVNMLVDAAANTNAQDASGNTALLYAASRNIELVRKLIYAGADPAICNDMGARAEKFATNSEIKKLLRTKGRSSCLSAEALA